MTCPVCHATRTGVLRTSRGADGTIVRRRYCGACKHRWTTYEVSESAMQRGRRALAKLRELQAIVTEPE